MNWASHYEILIEKAVQRGSKREKGKNQNHHIDPECCGGLNTPENMVFLYHREHLVAHLLLAKMYPDDPKLIHAAFRMSNRKRNGSRKYEWLKEKFSILQSEKMKGKIVSEETRQKISKGLKGRVISKETRKKLSEVQKGRILSEERRKRISKTQIGRIMSEDTKKKIGDGNRGKVLSDETRKKMAESWKKRPTYKGV